VNKKYPYSQAIQQVTDESEQ